MPGMRIPSIRCTVGLPSPAPSRSGASAAGPHQAIRPSSPTSTTPSAIGPGTSPAGPSMVTSTSHRYRSINAHPREPQRPEMMLVPFPFALCLGGGASCRLSSLQRLGGGARWLVLCLGGGASCRLSSLQRLGGGAVRAALLGAGVFRGFRLGTTTWDAARSCCAGEGPPSPRQPAHRLGRGGAWRRCLQGCLRAHRMRRRTGGADSRPRNRAAISIPTSLPRAWRATG